MADRTPKKVYSFRLDAQLFAYLKNYAKRAEVKRTAIIEALLRALQEGRLFVTPDTRPDPFPGVVRAELLPVRPFNSPVQPGTYPHRAEPVIEEVPS